MIDGLLSDSIDDVRVAARGLAATAPPCPPNPEVRNPAPITIPFETWAEDLIGSERRLFVVLQGTDPLGPDNIEVVLEVGKGADALYWRVTLADAEHGQVVRVHIPCSRSDGWGLPRDLSAYLVAPPRVVWDSGHTITTPARPWDEVLADAVGPLVVYSYGVLLERDTRPPWEARLTEAVVTYDAGAEREVARFEVSGRSLVLFGSIVGLAGDELLVRGAPSGTDDSTIVAYDLNGMRLRGIGDHLANQAGGSSVSPDGTIVASVGTVSACGNDSPCVAFVDIATGELLAAVPRSLLGPNAHGTPAPQVWRHDGLGVVAEGMPNGHRAFGVYTIMIDGSVQDHEIIDLGTPGPGGHYFAAFIDMVVPWQADAIGCDLYQTLRIHDLETHAIAAEAHEEGMSLRSILRWSPNGTEVLYGVSATRGATSEPCSLVFQDWLDQPTSWRVLDAASGTVTAVADPDAVLARWAEALGAPRLAFRCGTEERLLHEMQNGFWYPLSSCVDEEGKEAQVQFEVDGVQVNSFEPESNPLVIGVIQLDDD